MNLKACALCAQYWRFAPIINSLGGPQMCTMSHFRFSRFSFFSARFFFSVFLCGNIPQKTKILGPNCGIKKRNQGNKRKPGEKNSDSWFSYEFNNRTPLSSPSPVYVSTLLQSRSQISLTVDKTQGEERLELSFRRQS